MKKLVLLGAMLGLGSLCWAGSERRDAVDRLNNAAKVLDEIMGAPDRRISDAAIKRAKCVAVIPHLIKGGFVFGAEHGKGVATCRTAKSWSAPAFPLLSSRRMQSPRAGWSIGGTESSGADWKMAYSCRLDSSGRDR